MSKFETVEIPFKTVGNCQVLTEMQLAQEPWLLDFVNQFPHCFAHDPYRNVMVYYPNGYDDA